MQVRTGSGTSLGIPVQSVRRLAPGSSDPSGIEPATFYCFGSSNIPRQRDFLLLTLSKLGAPNRNRTCLPATVPFRSQSPIQRINLVVMSGIEPLPFFLMREAHKPFMLHHHIKTYSQQVSYVCCTVCYTHFLCEAPPGLGYVDEEYVFIWRTHCGQGSNLQVVSNSTDPFKDPRLPIPSPRVPEVNYSPVWMLSADNIYHIETH